jgi:hypothetical protein
MGFTDNPIINLPFEPPAEAQQRVAGRRQA